MRKRIRNLLALVIALTLVFSAIGFNALPTLSVWADDPGTVLTDDDVDDDLAGADDEDDDDEPTDEEDEFPDVDLAETFDMSFAAFAMQAQAETEFNLGDIIAFNTIIGDMDLYHWYPFAVPTDGSEVPEEWQWVVKWTGNDGDPNRRISELYLDDMGMIGFLDVSRLTELKILRCSENELTELLLGDIDLEELYCAGNDLVTLDLSKMSSLYFLQADRNHLTVIKLHADAFSNHWNYMNVRSNYFGSVNQAAQGKDIEAAEWDRIGGTFFFFPQMYDPFVFSPGTYNAADIAVLNALLAPEQRYEQAYPTDGSVIPVSWLDFTTWTDGIGGFDKRIDGLHIWGGELSGTLNFEALTELRFLDISMTKMDGIHFGALDKLDTLYLNWNENLTSLDVRGLTNLEYLDCTGNSLTNLLVSGLSKLDTLHAHGNTFTTLDLSGLTSLTYLGIAYGWLSELDVSDCLNLIDISVPFNGLTRLDLSMLEHLQWSNLEWNSLTEIILHPNAFTHPEGFYANFRNNYLASPASVKGNSALSWDVWRDDSWWDEENHIWYYQLNFAPQRTTTIVEEKKDDDKKDDGNTILTNAETQSDQTKHFGTSANAAKTWAAVSNEVVKLIETLPAATVEAGFNHIIHTGADIIVPAAVFDTLSDTNATIMMNTGIGVTFSISGGNIPDGFDVSSIDLTVRNGALNAPNNIVREMLTGTITSQQIPMKSREDFGMVIDQHYNFGSTNADNYANLYRYNEVTRAFEYLGSYRINEKGQAMFGITGAADYLVTVTETRPNIPVVASASGTYTVVPGDTLSLIASRNGLTVDRILALNPQITNRNAIRVGQQIRLR